MPLTCVINHVCNVMCHKCQMWWKQWDIDIRKLAINFSSPSCVLYIVVYLHVYLPFLCRSFLLVVTGDCLCAC